MTFDEFNIEVNYAAKGNSRYPAQGTDKYNRTMSIANRKIREWATDSTTKWASLFEERTYGQYSTSRTYELDDDISDLSDFVYLVKANGDRVEYNVIKPQQRSLHQKGVYISSNNPKAITFIDTVETTDELIGSIVTVPLFFIPEAITSGSDTIVVDSPEWLIYETAAELVRNDPAKDDQYGNLAGKANDMYQKMIYQNATNPYLQPNGVPNEMPQIVMENW